MHETIEYLKKISFATTFQKVMNSKKHVRMPKGLLPYLIMKDEF